MLGFKRHFDLGVRDANSFNCEYLYLPPVPLRCLEEERYCMHVNFGANGFDEGNTRKRGADKTCDDYWYRWESYENHGWRSCDRNIFYEVAWHQGY
jgi:hypothetical protein